jgi:hypothetical protein
LLRVSTRHNIAKLEELRMMPRVAIGLVLASLVAAPGSAQPVGRCGFNRTTSSFRGTATEQAKCLLAPVRKFGNLGLALDALPPVLGMRIGTVPRIDHTKLTAALARAGVVAGDLTKPVSRGRGGAADAPQARYFVIHDTSSPWLGDRSFPAALDSNPVINNVAGFLGNNAVAHIFILRDGKAATGHDYGVPWRATKLETQAIGLPAKGMFLHNELVQPRRRDPAGGSRNDAIAPVPGFSPAQYETLALLYAAASLRAGQWLIPGYHAAIDAGLADAHDDPQNFDLAAFDAALGRLIAQTGETP